MTDCPSGATDHRPDGCICPREVWDVTCPVHVPGPGLAASPNPDRRPEPNPYLAITPCPICGVWDDRNHAKECLNV